MTYSILLVDDELFALEGYRRQLSSFFDVQTAANGNDGLKMLLNYGPFAAVLVDYMMPGMNGVDFTVDARQVAPETIRIMLTGRGDTQVVAEALNRGSIFMFLSKPCPSDELLKAVIYAVEKYRGRDLLNSAVLPERIEGLKKLYQGLLHWSKGKPKAAITGLNGARQIFFDSGDQDNLARANLLITGMARLAATVLSESELCLDHGRLTAEAISIYKHKGFPTLLRNEYDLFLPALNWAYEKNIEKAFLKTILEDLGAPVQEKGLLTIQALGSLLVGNDNQWIEEADWRNPKVKLFFLYLLTYRWRKVDRDNIAEHFWPDMQPRAAGNNFSSILYSLRQLIGSDKVAYLKGLCWLVKEEYRCDADEFEETVKSAKRQLIDGQVKEAISLYEKAVLLYRGDYLEEFTYEDWIVNERERLQVVFTKTVNELANLLADQGRFMEAAEILEKTPGAEVLDDQFLYKLVNYYILAQSRSKAIRRYQYYRSVMVSELGVEPEPAIEKLFERKAGT